jgi:hypothetical protein
VATDLWFYRSMSTPDITAATVFIAGNARIVDRRRFERLFREGGSAPVRDAVAAYRNDDGGFGNGLEPDCRAPGSQPAAVEMALRIMDECDAWDPSLVRGACDWLAGVAPAGGGSAFVEPTLDGWPHAPWWVPEQGKPSMVSTGLISGTLHARGFLHPWLDRATQTMWELIGSATTMGPYDMYGALAFLQHVPDRDRAEAAFGRVGQMLLDEKLAAIDPTEQGETHSPLNFAPAPDSMARVLFETSVIDAHLDHLAAGQRDDGGWTFNWPAWSPAAERDWRGFLTVDALRILRANGRPVALTSYYP